MRQTQALVQKFLLSLLVLSAMTTIAMAADRPHSQVLVEVGWGKPYGDLAQDYTTTTQGFGAQDGLELGFRWRYHFTNTISLSPAFHFMDYRNFESTGPDIGDYRISASSLRYTLELMIIQGDATKPLRPFLAASGGWYRNRAIGYNKNLPQPFDESVNTLGLGMRGGVRMGLFEISAVYSWNRFATLRYFDPGVEQDYNWDNFGVRVGWIVPFSDGP